MTEEREQIELVRMLLERAKEKLRRRNMVDHMTHLCVTNRMALSSLK